MKWHFAPFAFALVATLLFPRASQAEIKGSSPRQYEVFEGVAAQFEGKAKGGAPPPSRATSGRSSPGATGGSTTRSNPR